jgi:type I restriction enzyme S subunit
VSALPPGWSWVTLNDLKADVPGAITDGPFGSHLTSAHYSAAGARVVRLQNIGDGKFNDAKAFIPTEHYEALRKHAVQPGDLLVASLGDELPRACLAPPGLGPAIVKADCIRVRLGPDVDPRWVLYAMQTPHVRRWAAEQLHGVGRLRLGLKVIRALPMPLAPLEEQRTIVGLLEDHLSRLDQAIRSADAAHARTRLLLPALIERAVRTAGGAWSPLADHVAEVKNGVFVSRASAVPDGVPILRIGSVRPLHLDLTDLRYSSRSQDDLARANALLRGGDLLFTCYNGNPRFVGACVVVPEGLDALTYPDKLIRVRVRDHVDPTFLAYACSVGKGRAQIQRAVKTTSGQAGISGKDLRAVEVPMPSLQAQRAAVRDVERGLDALPSLTEGLARVRLREAALRRRLFAAAFSGELSSDDAALEGSYV